MPLNRIEIEIKLGRDRAWTLETWAAYSATDLTRPLTVSRHDPAFRWSALDHLTHLAGIEVVFNDIIRRFIAGDPRPISIGFGENGERLSMPEIMARVHALNDAYLHRHRDKTFAGVVTLGQTVRAETLSLLAGLSDEQIAQVIPGAPWADGTSGGIIAINGDHARQHHGWVTAALAKETAN
ncbi:MAG: DinB family protein [Blastocatellia bacterium]